MRSDATGDAEGGRSGDHGIGETVTAHHDGGGSGVQESDGLDALRDFDGGFETGGSEHALDPRPFDTGSAGRRGSGELSLDRGGNRLRASDDPHRLRSLGDDGLDLRGTETGRGNQNDVGVLLLGESRRRQSIGIHRATHEDHVGAIGDGLDGEIGRETVTDRTETGRRSAGGIRTRSRLGAHESQSRGGIDQSGPTMERVGWIAGARCRHASGERSGRRLQDRLHLRRSEIRIARQHQRGHPADDRGRHARALLEAVGPIGVGRTLTTVGEGQDSARAAGGGDVDGRPVVGVGGSTSVGSHGTDRDHVGTVGRSEDIGVEVESGVAGGDHDHRTSCHGIVDGRLLDRLARRG